MEDEKNIIEPEIEEKIEENTLEKMGEVIEKIEQAKQTTAIRQIETTDKDNERQYQFAKLRENNELQKWNKAFWIGTAITVVLSFVSLYLILFENDKSLGLGLLSTTLAGVFGFIAGTGSCKGN